jgi:8-oxo-dGTP pyrophosphatase MutT (NUDIX family)
MPHTDEKVCLTIVAFLTRRGKVLLVNHPKYDRWLPIGGHIDKGEDPEQALFREIQEEANLQPEDVRIEGTKPSIPGEHHYPLFTPAFVNRHGIQDRDHVAFVYFGEVQDGREPSLSEEHLELCWFSKDELEKPGHPLKPDILWYSLEALRRASKT